jgi:hypothetical protein
VDAFDIFALLVRENVPFTRWPRAGPGSFPALAEENVAGYSRVQMKGDRRQKTLVRMVFNHELPLDAYEGLDSRYE